MAIEDNALAQYYGPREQGLATVLPGQKGQPFGLLVQAVAAGQARKRKAVNDAMKDLKAGTPWKPFMRHYQEMYNKTVEEIAELSAQGREEEAALLAKQRGAELKLYADASVQLGNQYQQLLEQGRKSGIVRDDAYAQMLMSQLYDENGNLRDPRDINVEDLSLDKLTTMPGASEILDGARVLRKAADTLLKPREEYKEEDVPDEYSGGFRIFKKKQISTKLRPYEYFDPAEGKVKVMSPAELAESGVVDTFLEDPYARRIIEDTASTRYAEEEPAMAVAKATYDLINEYQLSDGVAKVAVKETQRAIPRATVGGGGGSKGPVLPHPWLPAIDRALRGDVDNAPTVYVKPEKIPKLSGEEAPPRVWLDVSSQFGATTGGALTSLPTMKVRSPNDPSKEIEVHPSRVLANPDKKEMLLEYAVDPTDEDNVVYKRYVPQAKGRGDASPIYDLLLNAKDNALESGQRFGYLDAEGNFIVGGKPVRSDIEFEHMRKLAEYKDELLKAEDGTPVFEYLKPTSEGVFFNSYDNAGKAVAHLNRVIRKRHPVIDSDGIRGEVVGLEKKGSSVIVKVQQDDGNIKEVAVSLYNGLDKLRKMFAEDVISFK